MLYLLSIGSNIGNKKDNLAKALQLLEEKGARVQKRSSFYLTQPVDFLDQPDFVNLAAEVESSLVPEEFLSLIKDIERAMGRKRSEGKGPRIIDIDILFAEDLIIETQMLTVPHPGMAERKFVLVPLEEIAPDALHPILQKTVSQMCRETRDASSVKILHEDVIDPQK